MRGRIVSASLILLAAILLSGCTVTKSLSPEAQQKVQRVAIVSVIGHQILMKNSPFFRWDMEERAYSIDDWGIDALVKQEITRELGGHYQIVPAEYDAA